MMNVLFVSNEVAPFAKVGGLADVAGSLPQALADRGVDIRVVMPLHRSCPAVEQCSVALPCLSVQTPYRALVGSVLESRLPGSDVPVYFIKYDPFFDRPDPYGEGATDYPDSPQRYAFFARAALALNHALGFEADVYHANDWPTGLLPTFQRLNPHGRPTVFTIHNLGYQGSFPLSVASDIDIDPASPAMPLVQLGDRINYMAAAIRSATVVNTVSERYAREIQTPGFGHGLDGLLKDRSDVLHGILNGLDYDDWDPRDVSTLPAGFSPERLQGKARCKAALQEHVGLEVNPDIPLAVAVSRLVHQKGLDVLAEVLPRMVDRPMQFAMLGTGDADLERRYRALAQANPGRVAASIEYNEDLARLHYAGADIFIMPSRYEPCGLGQLIAMAYGTVPVVHATGGLADTVSETADEQTGFVCGYLDPQDLLSAIMRAGDAWYHTPKRWRRLMRRIMRLDFSWSASAREYVALYEEAQRISEGG
jgi:starch synthase